MRSASEILCIFSLLRKKCSFAKTFLEDALIVDTFQAGFEGETAVSVLRRLIGPYGLLKDIIANRASVYDLLKPLTKPDVSSNWRDFFSQVQLTVDSAELRMSPSSPQKTFNNNKPRWYIGLYSSYIQIYWPIGICLNTFEMNV